MREAPRGLRVTPEQWQLIQRILNDHLPEQQRVLAFGSRANGNPKPYSDLDLDLAIIGDQQVSIDTLAKLSKIFSFRPRPESVAETAQ